MCTHVFVENDDSALNVGNKIFLFSCILNQMGSKNLSSVKSQRETTRVKSDFESSHWNDRYVPFVLGRYWNISVFCSPLNSLGWKKHRQTLPIMERPRNKFRAAKLGEWKTKDTLQTVEGLRCTSHKNVYFVLRWYPNIFLKNIFTCFILLKTCQFRLKMGLLGRKRTYFWRKKHFQQLF